MKQKNLFHIIVASGFGSGFSPFAPGTAGAALATVIWFILAFIVSPTFLLIATISLIIIFTILGIWSANVLEPTWGKDPSRVVVDEMVGVWIPLLACDMEHWYYAFAAFVLFRFFDILKPLGIRRMESLKGGVGVMMDDILAGVYSLLILLVIRWLAG